MPYKNKERRNLIYRSNRRSARHGNWRQIVVDQGGMCTFVLDDGSICGETSGLEFHEVFGENGHRDDPKFQVRVLRCPCHHAVEHGLSEWDEFRRRYMSRLNEDVSLEIYLCGGYNRWVEKYGLVDRFGYSIWPRRFEAGEQLRFDESTI